MTAYLGAKGRCGSSYSEEKSSSMEGKEDLGLHRARESRPRLCSNCSALVPVAAVFGCPWELPYFASQGHESR